MTKLKIALGLSLFLTFSSYVFADSAIVTQTSTWKSVPIQVDTVKHTYTTTSTDAVPTSDYYYSYPGYRCFREKRDLVGVNALIFNASISGGSEIYCYPE